MGTRQRRDHSADLSQALAAGDPLAMWEFALRSTGLADAYAGFPGNPLPLLTRLADRVTQDGITQAHDLIERAAAAGYPPAMVVQAIWVTRSDRQGAITLFEQAAGQGDAAAMLALARLLEPDQPEAAKAWLTKLADQGDDTGMYALSRRLLADDPQASADWLAKAAAAGNVHAQSDLAVAAFERGQPLDPGHPPAVDPRLTGLLTPNTPLTRQARQVANCVKCGGKTVQDRYEFIHGRFFGLRGPTTAGKTGARVHFSGCTVCGCLYPVDEASRQYVAAKGGEFFNPAKLR